MKLRVVIAFCAALPWLVGCAAPTVTAGAYPDPQGPRNGVGALVDPRTGIALPGQNQGGV